MKRKYLALFAWLALACDRKPPSPGPAAAPSSVPPPATVASAAASAAPSAAPAPPPQIGPGDGDRAARTSAVLSVLSGNFSASALAEVATEPGETLDPFLRNSLAPRSRVNIRMGKVNVVGDQIPEVVRRIVRSHRGRFDACYLRGLENNPNLEGRITLQIVISKDGEVRAVSDGGSDLPDSGVRGCVKSAVQAVKFPKSESGSVSRASVPLLLSPQ